MEIHINEDARLFQFERLQVSSEKRFEAVAGAFLISFLVSARQLLNFMN